MGGLARLKGKIKVNSSGPTLHIFLKNLIIIFVHFDSRLFVDCCNIDQLPFIYKIAQIKFHRFLIFNL